MSEHGNGGPGSVPDEIFKAYDVRGIYDTQMDATTNHLIGRAFARVLADLRGKQPADLTVGVGRDMRLQAPEMAAAVRDGLVAEGASVVDVGMVGTEMLYFAVGAREMDGGAMITASHNPKAYTGVKLVREGALALSGDTGITAIRDLILAGLGEAPGGGSVAEVDIYPEFSERAMGFVEATSIEPIKVVVDGGNGMAGRDGRPTAREAAGRADRDLLGARRRTSLTTSRTRCCPRTASSSSIA